MSPPPAADDQAPDDPVARLYAIAPEEFVAARKELAAQLKAAGHREEAAAVLALRKPTAAAWAVNLLAAADPDAVARLGDLGDRLRAAQERLDGAALREGGGQRRALVADLTRAAVAAATDAGRPPSGAVREQIEQTLAAAVADAETAERVRTGRLVGAGEVAPGLGPMTLPEGAPTERDAGSAPSVVRIAPGRPGGRAPGRSGGRSRGAGEDTDGEGAREEAARAARRDLIAKAEEALAQATAEASQAATALEGADADHEAARARLDAARAELEAAERSFTETRQAQQRATTRARRAAEALAAAAKRREALGD